MPMIVTKDTGGTTMPIGMTIAEPERARTDVDLSTAAELDGGLNVPFVLGTLSAFLAHERAGAALYAVAAEHSTNPMLADKYAEFGAETIEHVAIYEGLIAELGGDPNYISPAARMTEQFGSKLLEAPMLLAGSVDAVSLETNFLEAVILAEHKCHDNWHLLSAFAGDLPEGAIRDAIIDAVARVEPQEDEHISWATNTWQQLAVTQAKQPAASKAMSSVEGVINKVKDALS
jgi:hypothetical protein